jgi:hypothetical protein
MVVIALTLGSAQRIGQSMDGRSVVTFPIKDISLHSQEGNDQNDIERGYHIC